MGHRKRVAGIFLGGLALLLPLAQARGAPIVVIDGAGNFGPGYSHNSSAGTGVITTGQTVGGVGAAQVSFDVQNEYLSIGSATPRPLLGDNNTISMDIFVTATDEGGTQQGENRMKITFNKTGFSQVDQWVSMSLGWYPTQANTWTSFSFDMSTQAWFTTTDFSDWEVFRVKIYENNDSPYTNSFAVRNLVISNPIPEPASFCLMGLGALAICSRARRIR